MITRVFRAIVPEKLHDAFETKFRTVSVPLVRGQPGFESVTIGRPTRWNPNEFVMVSVWRDEESIAGFVGPAWNEPHIPEGMEHFITSCTVDHYEVIEPD